MPQHGNARAVLAVFGSLGATPGTALTIHEARLVAPRLGVTQSLLIDGAIAGTALGWFELGASNDTLILTDAGAAELRKGVSLS